VKKLLYIIILLALSSFATTFAASITTNNVLDMPFNGFYGSVSGGVFVGTNKINSHSYTITSIHYLQQSGGDVVKTSGIGVLALGFGHEFNQHLYLGAEAFASYANRNPNSINLYFNDPLTPISVNLNSKMKMRKCEYGIDLKPGIVFDHNTLFYGRLGVAFNKIALESSSLLRSGPDIVRLEAKKQKSIALCRFGLGTERMLTKNLSVHFDYIFSFGKRINAYGTMPFGGETIIQSFSVTPKSHQFLLGFSYYIGDNICHLINKN